MERKEPKARTGFPCTRVERLANGSSLKRKDILSSEGRRGRDTSKGESRPGPLAELIEFITPSSSRGSRETASRLEIQKADCDT